MTKIQEYKIEPIYASGDYGRQAIILRDKILSDAKLLPKDSKTDENKWEWCNFYQNVYIYWYLILQDMFEGAFVASMADNTANENAGWFTYPRKHRIHLGNADDYKTIDEYNVAVYDKYFDSFFNFTISSELVDKYFIEAKTAYKEGKYYCTVCSLFPIIEYYSRLLSAYSSEDGNFTQRTALNAILERIPKWPSVPSVSIDYFTNEYRKIKDFMLDNYYKHSKQEDPEPQFICRHRLLHGIITRDVTASDCLRLFLIIRSFSYLERLFVVAEKLIKYNSLTLQTEDRLLFGDEEYEKLIADLLQ